MFPLPGGSTLDSLLVRGGSQDLLSLSAPGLYLA